MKTMLLAGDGARFQAIAESSPHATCVLDATTEITWFNDAMLPLGAYSRDQLLGAPSFASFIAPESREPAKSNFRKALEGRPYEADLVLDMIRADGEKLRCESHLSGWKDDQGRINLIISLIDITERNRTEAELLTALADLRRSEEIAGIGSWKLDLATHTFTASEEGLRSFGFPSGIMPTYQDVAECLVPEDLARASNCLKRSLETGEPYSIEVKIRRRDNGEIRNILSNAAIQRAPGGAPGYVLGTNQDITERKRMEKALKESELKYRSLIESSSDVVFCVDANGQYQFTNQVFASTFEKTPEYFVGKTFWDIYPKEHADFRQETSRMVFETGESQSVEVVVPLPDRTLYFIAKANPIRDETGKVVLNLTHATDITERKLAEERIKTLLAEKETLLKEVHHRIKNNMNTISGLLNLQAGTLNDPRAIRALEDAESRVQSMMLLYDKLYLAADFNKIEANEYLPALVDEIIANFPNRASVRIEKDIGGFVLGAAKLQPLGIIINELLTNIMKYAFTDRSGGLVSIALSLAGNMVSLDIHDDGRGMPESIDFERSNGFGLMLVGQLTKQLGGTIRIEREGGTRIVLDFPI